MFGGVASPFLSGGRAEEPSPQTKTACALPNKKLAVFLGVQGKYDKDDTCSICRTGQFTRYKELDFRLQGMRPAYLTHRRGLKTALISLTKALLFMPQHRLSSAPIKASASEGCAAVKDALWLCGILDSRLQGMASAFTRHLGQVANILKKDTSSSWQSPFLITLPIKASAGEGCAAAKDALWLCGVLDSRLQGMASAFTRHLGQVANILKKILLRLGRHRSLLLCPSKPARAKAAQQPSERCGCAARFLLGNSIFFVGQGKMRKWRGHRPYGHARAIFSF